MIYQQKEFTVKNGLNVTVKTPEVEDAEQLLNFIKVMTGETDFLLSSPEDFKSDVEKEKMFISGIRESSDYLLCAYVDGKVVGDCSISFDSHLKSKHRANLGIGILKDYWNIGIGSLFFSEMIRLAKEKGEVEQLELSYVQGNERAKALYTKFGFKEVGTKPRAIKLKDGTYRDIVLMVKFLEE